MCRRVFFATKHDICAIYTTKLRTKCWEAKTTKHLKLFSFRFLLPTISSNCTKQLLQKTSYPRCRNNENERTKIGANCLGQKIQDILNFPFGLHCIKTLTSHIQFLFIIATLCKLQSRLGRISKEQNLEGLATHIS